MTNLKHTNAGSAARECARQCPPVEVDGILVDQFKQLRDHIRTLASQQAGVGGAT
jgi:hypothetical protein